MWEKNFRNQPQGRTRFGGGNFGVRREVPRVEQSNVPQAGFIKQDGLGWGENN